MRVKARWRGTIIAGICVACFYILMYGFNNKENSGITIWLWIFAMGSILGGLLSLIDSIHQFRIIKKYKNKN